MESWVSNFFCCSVKNHGLEPTEKTFSDIPCHSLKSCSCSTTSSFTEVLSVSENSLTEGLELRDCKPKSEIKITILPFVSEYPKPAFSSLGNKTPHLHYSSVIYESELMSQTNLPFSQDVDYTQNYGDVIIDSRPPECPTEKWPSSFLSTSTPLTHENMDLLNKLQKARYVSNRQLPPLPRSPKRSFVYKNTSSYNTCRTFL